MILSFPFHQFIIFLYESWGGECSKFDIDGFKCFNFYRKFQNRRAKRNSGEIVLYILYTE